MVWQYLCKAGGRLNLTRVLKKDVGKTIFFKKVFIKFS